MFFTLVKKKFQELTRVNPDRNIFSINVELLYLVYRGPSPTPNFKYVVQFLNILNLTTAKIIGGRGDIFVQISPLSSKGL